MFFLVSSAMGFQEAKHHKDETSGGEHRLMLCKFKSQTHRCFQKLLENSSLNFPATTSGKAQFIELESDEVRGSFDVL